jgi:hypothetical protein
MPRVPRLTWIEDPQSFCYTPHVEHETQQGVSQCALDYQVEPMNALNAQDVKRAAMLVMLLMLVYTAPQWLLSPGQAKTSSYEAPWIYPGLEPQNSH